MMAPGPPLSTRLSPYTQALTLPWPAIAACTPLLLLLLLLLLLSLLLLLLSLLLTLLLLSLLLPPLLLMLLLILPLPLPLAPPGAAAAAAAYSARSSAEVRLTAAQSTGPGRRISLSLISSCTHWPTASLEEELTCRRQQAHQHAAAGGRCIRCSKGGGELLLACTQQ